MLNHAPASEYASGEYAGREHAPLVGIAVRSTVGGKVERTSLEAERKGREAGSELLEGDRNSTQENKVKYEQKQSRHIRKDGDTPKNQLSFLPSRQR